MSDDAYLQPRSRKAPPGHKGQKARFVYFVQAETLGLIKIGIARCMASRLSGLQTGSPDKLVLLGVVDPANRSAYSLEQDLHARFWESRHHGEWFKPTPRLRAYIARNAVSLAEIQRRDAEAAMEKLVASQARLWAVRAPEAPRPDPDVELPKGKSRAARLARYKLARGLAA